MVGGQGRVCAFQARFGPKCVMAWARSGQNWHASPSGMTHRAIFCWKQNELDAEWVPERSIVALPITHLGPKRAHVDRKGTPLCPFSSRRSLALPVCEQFTWNIPTGERFVALLIYSLRAEHRIPAPAGQETQRVHAPRAHSQHSHHRSR